MPTSASISRYVPCSWHRLHPEKELIPVVHVKILLVNHRGVGCREGGALISPRAHVAGNLQLVIRGEGEIAERRLDRLNQIHTGSGFNGIKLLDFGNREGTVVNADVVNHAMKNPIRTQEIPCTSDIESVSRFHRRVDNLIGGSECAVPIHHHICPRSYNNHL